MVCTLYSMGLFGLDAFRVEVESDISRGLPVFKVTGLPDTAVRESANRVKSAIKNCGFEFPNSIININLAPADIKKSGSKYDLPILLSILISSGQLEFKYDDSIFIGELSLSGALRKVDGVLSMVIQAKADGFRKVFLPKENAAEGAVVEGIDVYPVENLSQLILHLTQEELIEKALPLQNDNNFLNNLPDFSEVKGQQFAKRALEVACAGSHNLLLIGPPGSGKSMLAKRIPSILPQMSFNESIETTRLHSIAGTLPSGVSLIDIRPFRAPHHTISSVGLTGGGSIPHPGEISLAHNGVLFLDELPEFSRATLEVLRQPIEDGIVTISRANATLTYPCSMMLVAAMNPCPCGYFGSSARPCTCTSQAVDHYLQKVSGPLLDRLDLHVEVPTVDYDSLSSTAKSESSDEIKKRVDKARKIQQDRYQNTLVTCNARLTPALLQQTCNMTGSASAMIKLAFEKLGLSGRAYDRVLKISRTIADLDGEETIQTTHVSEAVQYRSLDRKYWLKND